MTTRIDEGDILGQVLVPITDDDTGESLFRKIAAAGGPLLADVVGQVLAGTAQRHQQDEAQSSYFAAPSDEDGQIDWSRDAVSIRNLVRGLNLRPGAWTTVNGERWRVLTAAICPTASPADPGTILEVSPWKWRVATGSQDLWLDELRPEDPVISESASSRLMGVGISPGLILGASAANERS
jgi:methionyl-tRNA formyltransferase